MTTITYNQISSKFYSKAEAYDLFALNDMQLVNMKDEQIHSAATEPYIRRLFSSLALDDEIQEIKFEMKYPIDAETDKDFVIDILAIGVIIQQLTGKVNSTLHIKQMIGDSAEKFYSQAQHLTELQDLLANNRLEQRRLIRDRGSIYNSYLDE